ncbi:MAG: hypothetical protein ACOYN6_01895 [Ignavibacteria bacterium]
MNIQDLLNKGYFPKELPPSFFTEVFANNYNQINNDLATNEATALQTLLNNIDNDPNISANDKVEAKVKTKTIFKNKLKFSDSVQFTIPKVGLARNTIKIPNPLHQGKLSEVISQNFNDISRIYNLSIQSTTKPKYDASIGEGKRSVKHESFSYFKEQCVLNSFSFQFQVKTDISKYYSSIYTHTIPWVTFGSKESYKRNRNLSDRDNTKILNIYGDDIDNRLMWCQNQQTMGIPIGPDTSLIVAELIACHIDNLLTNKLSKKKIEWIGYRYYDDYMMYFNSELDAQIGFTELRTILAEFELNVNDEKTKISRSTNELDKDWAISLKSFLFRPNESEQKEDIWNFYSLAFRLAKENPSESVLKLALNKFNFVRIEKDNWSFFESLLFRLGLSEPASLQRLSKILVSYKSLVTHKKLKTFCFELINRHYAKCNDYEMTWALWLLNEFNLQPTKEIYYKVFKSKSVSALIIALDLLSQNKRIRNFDYSDIIPIFSTDNLNNKYWLLIYEVICKNWVRAISPSILSNHFFFQTMKDNNVYFYDSSRKLEPLKVEKNYFNRISKKIAQVKKYIENNNLRDENIKEKITQLFGLLSVSELQSDTTREDIQKSLNESDSLFKDITEKLKQLHSEQSEFEDKKVYFVVSKRLEELANITAKEIELQTRHDKDLLFDPKYD